MLSLANHEGQMYVEIGPPFNCGAYVTPGDKIEVVASPHPTHHKRRGYLLEAFGRGLSLIGVKFNPITDSGNG